MTKNGKELRSPHVKYCKEKLSGYGIDPFTLGYPIKLSSREKNGKNIYNNMCKVEILRKKNFNFIQERLINGKIGVSDPVKKNNLKTRIKSEKQIKN